jgi:hypothetical protein
VTTNDGPGVPPERAPETTSVFRADFLADVEPPVAREQSVSGVDALPAGSALLVVKRGPNAGSRFLLDRSTTSAGRHPDSDIFLDDVTVSRWSSSPGRATRTDHAARSPRRARRRPSGGARPRCRPCSVDSVGRRDGPSPGGAGTT